MRNVARLPMRPIALPAIANAARILMRVEGEDDEARTETLQAFLPDHYAEDDQERADIIAYMLSL